MVGSGAQHDGVGGRGKVVLVGLFVPDRGGPVDVTFSRTGVFGCKWLHNVLGESSFDQEWVQYIRRGSCTQTPYSPGGTRHPSRSNTTHSFPTGTPVPLLSTVDSPLTRHRSSSDDLHPSAGTPGHGDLRSGPVPVTPCRRKRYCSWSREPRTDRDRRDWHGDE